MTTFQTARDREAQFKAASAIELAWNVRAERTEAFAPYDYRLYRGTAHVASIEVKRRYVPRDRYPTIILSANKATVLALMVPDALLVVAWDDDIGWHRLFLSDLDYLRVAGREPRPGAVHDQELVIDIPIDRFHPLTEWPTCLAHMGTPRIGSSDT